MNKKIKIVIFAIFSIVIVVLFYTFIKMSYEDKNSGIDENNKQKVVQNLNIETSSFEDEDYIPDYLKMYAKCTLNIRIGASSDADIYDTVEANTELYVADNFIINGWRRIKYDNKELYVNGKYLSNSPTIYQ